MAMRWEMLNTSSSLWLTKMMAMPLAFSVSMIRYRARISLWVRAVVGSSMTSSFTS